MEPQHGHKHNKPQRCDKKDNPKIATDRHSKHKNTDNNVRQRAVTYRVGPGTTKPAAADAAVQPRVQHPETERSEGQINGKVSDSATRLKTDAEMAQTNTRGDKDSRSENNERIRPQTNNPATNNPRKEEQNTET